MRFEAGEGRLEGAIFERKSWERCEGLGGYCDWEGDEGGVAEEGGERVVELDGGWKNGISLTIVAVRILTRMPGRGRGVLPVIPDCMMVSQS